MSRVSKVRLLNLEREVIELRQKGFGPHTIAKTLNERHNLQSPNALIFTNVYNFLKSEPKELVASIKEEYIRDVYLEPLSQLKQDLADLRGPLMQKAKAILLKEESVLDKDEIASLATYLRHSEEIWDRIAKIENILKPDEVIKAKNVLIIQQFNQIKEVVNEIVGSCETCKTKFLDKLAKVVEVDATVQ